jgi:hypothetical protein
MPFAALLMALVRKRKKAPACCAAALRWTRWAFWRTKAAAAIAGRRLSRNGGAHALGGAHAPRLQTICVHSRAWHEAGGNAVQELAFTLATGVEYLREMNKRGLDVNTVAPRIRFAVTVGVNFFMEIAKAAGLADAVVAGGGGAGRKRKAQNGFPCTSALRNGTKRP